MAQGREEEQEGDEFEAQAVSAFGEAFNNVAIHGYRDLAPGNVDIEISWTQEQIVIEMSDSGRTFDPDATPPPALDELPEGGPPGGERGMPDGAGPRPRARGGGGRV